MIKRYYCAVDRLTLTEKIVNSGAGTCYVLPSKVGNCITCGNLREEEV